MNTTEHSDPRSRTPVTVLTGFLGSGKSTLLRYLLSQNALRDTLVIVNEFGEMGIDHDLLVEQGDDSIIELASGCLCCTIRGDLIQTLGNAIWRYARNGKPWFRRVVIETTGLADPAPILHTLMAQPFVSSLYRLAAVVSCVDARHGLDTMQRQIESVKQAAMADRIVITKVDLVDESQLASVKRTLHALNPSAPLLVAEHGKVDADALIDDGDYDPESRSGDVLAWLGEQARSDDAHEHAHEHEHAAQGHDPNRHDARIHAVCIRRQQPLHAATLQGWLELLLSLHGPDLLRIKGLINVEGVTGPMVIHGVQHVFSPPTELARWPSDDHSTRVVFIVRDIDARMLHNSLLVAELQHKQQTAAL